MTDLMERNVNFREATCDVPSGLNHDLIKKIARQNAKKSPKVKIPKNIGHKEALAVHFVAGRLDKITPDWFTKVNPWTVVLHSMKLCVLGQIYGHYNNGLDVLHANNMVTHPGGVYVFSPDNFIESHLVTKAWRREIRARR